MIVRKNGLLPASGPRGAIAFLWPRRHLGQNRALIRRAISKARWQDEMQMQASGRRL